MSYEVYVQEVSRMPDDLCKKAYDRFDENMTGDAMAGLNHLALHYQSTQAVVDHIAYAIPAIVAPSPTDIRPYAIARFIAAIEHAVRKARS